jgi:hypothetical protein
MDQAPNQDGGDPTSQTSMLTASWAAWEKYYQEASRRRRARGGRHQLREEKRRRRVRERVGLAISAAVVGGLTLVFYLVLTH